MDFTGSCTECMGFGTFLKRGLKSPSRQLDQNAPPTTRYKTHCILSAVATCDLHHCHVKGVLYQLRFSYVLPHRLASGEFLYAYANASVAIITSKQGALTCT